jgi:hypothetical protein
MDEDTSSKCIWKYNQSLHLFVAFAFYASQWANEKPNDNDRKRRIAAQDDTSLHKDNFSLPWLTTSLLVLFSAMCDIDDITKNYEECQRSVLRSLHNNELLFLLQLMLPKLPRSSVLWLTF